jgi:hypothetical protein
MDYVEGYVEEIATYLTCAYCKWHVSEVAGRRMTHWYNHYCLHFKWVKEEDSRKYIGTEMSTPSWCPVGKANVSPSKKDC